jgi:hypothetical protein
MALPSKNADLYRRLRFYAFGLLLGCLLVSVIFKGRSCQMPGSVKMEELAYQDLEITKHGECRMKCRNITEGEIRSVLKSGKINYDKSNVRDTPCGTYAVEGNTVDGQHVRIIIADCDTISKVVTAIDLNLNEDDQKKDDCDCH